MRTEFIMSELMIGLRRNKTMTIAAIVTITIAATLLGAALMVRDGANQLQQVEFSNLEVSVYMNPACGTKEAPPTNCLTEPDQKNIESTLQHLPQVENITYVSTATAYANFKKYFASEPDLIKNTPPDALPTSFAVQLKDPHQFAIINSAVSNEPGVQAVTNAQQALKALFSFFHKVEVGVLFLALFSLGASLLLIYNTMLVAAFTRRRETGIMRLVGASDLYIQAPFVLEGTVIGVIGSLLAIVLLALVRWFISSATRHSPSLEPFGTIGPFEHALPAVVLVGVLLPAIASFATLQRHLRV